MFQTINVPNYGLSQSRENLPQITSTEEFLRYLRKNFVTYKEVKVAAHELKPSQQKFDPEKIKAISGKSSPIIISQDGFILDGHHRWLRDYNAGNSCHAIQVAKGILDLIAMARVFLDGLTRDSAPAVGVAHTIAEAVTRKKLAPHITHFAKFAAEHLGLDTVPHIELKSLEGSFGGYSPASQVISLATKHRHPMDIFRTLAHELAHRKQDQDRRIKDPEVDGETGSPIENEANAEAGKIMRHYAKKHPDKFSLQHVSEAADPDDPAAREFATTSLKNIYAKATPGEGKRKKLKLKIPAATAEDGIGPTTTVTGTIPPFTAGPVWEEREKPKYRYRISRRNKHG